MKDLVTTWRETALQMESHAQHARDNDMIETATLQRVRAAVLRACADELDAQIPRRARKSVVFQGNPRVPIYPGRHFPVGLANAARRIGCTAGHLHQVLSGKRLSEVTAKAYQALVEELEAKPRVTRQPASHA